MTELPEFDHLVGKADKGVEIELGDLLRKLWRRRRVIFGTTASLTILAAVLVFQLTPLFTATTRVMIEPRRSQVVNVQAVLSGLLPDTETINSEIQVIQSRQLAQRIVKSLKLDQDPEFNPSLRPKSFWSWVSSYKSLLPAALSSPEPVSTPEQVEERVRTVVTDTFLEKLTVVSMFRSWVIEIAVRTDDPHKSALIANTVADLYIVEQLEAKFEATRVASKWLSDRLAALRQEVEISERAAEQYRREAGIVEGRDSVTGATQQLTEINTELVLAASRRAEADARLNQVKILLKFKRDVGSIGEVLNSPLIQRLLEQESEVLRRNGELSAEFGPKHPRMINLKAEIRDLRRKIATEIDKIVQGLSSEVEVAIARERSLAGNLRRLEVRIGIINQKQVQLRALTRDALANRTVYESFLARFKEMGGQEDLQQPDARIISRAGLPISQSYPKKTLMIALAFMGSLMLGMGLVFVVERLDSGFRSMSQIEQFTRFPALGLVPQVTGKYRNAPERIVLDEPISAYGESMRNLFVSLMLSNVDKPPKVVLFTSSMPGEGKSVVSLSLARTVALSGRKALLIDCDLRQPVIHDKMELPRTPGLVELLADRAELSEVIRRDEATGADLIMAGEQVVNTVDLLGSEQMKKLLATFSKTYDLVILDSPPVLAVADARVLATQADKTVFVVRWERTRRDAAMLALRQLDAANGNIAGIVLSRVDVKKHAAYGFADSGYYHGKYKKYYTT